MLAVALGVPQGYMDQHPPLQKKPPKPPQTPTVFDPYKLSGFHQELL